MRYRALVLLTGFNDPRAKDVMRESLTSPNDRLRTVAYSFFEHHPDRALVRALLAALDKEQAEFVRPALMRALAALGRRCRARTGAESPRSAALVRDVDSRRGLLPQRGDRGARRLPGGRTRFDALIAVATLDGPLQDDAVLALGKIGDKRALGDARRSAAHARRAQTQPSIAAAICLLGVNCASAPELSRSTR